MALVTLVIQDAAEGGVNAQAFSEPPLAETQEPTKAQAALIVALNAVTAAARDAAPRILTPN